MFIIFVVLKIILMFLCFFNDKNCKKINSCGIDYIIDNI